MKRYPLILSGILAILWGCNKTHTSLTNTRQSTATNVRLVPENVARNVAIGFSADQLYSAGKGTNHSPYKSALHGNNSIKNSFAWNDRWGQPAVYVYNFANDGGFLLVSADSAFSPVLAFVERGEFKNETFPAGVNEWVKKTMSNIEIVRAGLYKPDIPVSAWALSASSTTDKGNVRIPANSPGGPPPNCIFTPSSSVFTVGPLLPVTWGQQCTYNELCGATGVNYNCNDFYSCSTHPPTGCVATAIAQVMYYWQPTNQYNYNYSSMPLDYGNTEVERLMSDIGLPQNANMNYHCVSDGGSSTSAQGVPSVLLNMGFHSATYSAYNYGGVVSDITVYNSPVILSGSTGSEIHEWVCDGYTSTTYTYTSSCNPGHVYYNGVGNVLFHMNWGWHEVIAPNDFNGWFSVSNWTITEPDQTLYFQYDQSMVSSIHP